MYSYGLDEEVYYSKDEVAKELHLTTDLVSILLENVQCTGDKFLGADVMKVYDIGILAR